MSDEEVLNSREVKEYLIGLGAKLDELSLTKLREAQAYLKRRQKQALLSEVGYELRKMLDELDRRIGA